tara:strand:- start:577 stop:789 length:213 start_codon:yes stop_codon:yes gene_type:complete
MLPPDQTERLLNSMPPLLEGYEAVCVAIALGDVDMAFYLAKQNAKNAKVFKKKLTQCFDLRDHRKNRKPV